MSSFPGEKEEDVFFEETRAAVYVLQVCMFSVLGQA
jgi:hypothetical protein